jgi:hypothetical protein
MATVVKDFKVKSGLVVEGANATVGGSDVLTKKQDDQDYIIGLIGGSSDSSNTPNTVVKRDENGDFAAGEITATLIGDVQGNADTATALETSRTIELTGDVTGSVAFDGTSNVQISATIDSSFATDAEVATAKSEAIAAAESYTDDEVLAHSNATSGVHGVTGDVVGTTDTQTLTNKVLGSGTQASDDIDMNGNKIIDLATPTDGTDAVTKNYADAGDQATLTAAESYTDGREIAITTAYELYADTAEADAISAAASSAAALYAPLAGATFTGDVILNADPTQALGAATKQYVDSVAEGLHIHASVVALSDSNIALPTAPSEIDGVTLSDGDRVLLAGQTDLTENGIYVVSGTDLVRADDHDTAAEIQAGDFVFVSGGTNYAATGWVQENTVDTLGSDPIVWGQFSGAGTYLAGTGLELNGSTFEIDESYTATRSYVDGEITTANQSAQDAADTAEANAEAYTDARETAITTAYENYANQVLADAKIYTDDEINALDTDDIEEGAANLYFTDDRAKDAVAAAIAAGTHDNIIISYDSQTKVFTFEAENGVEDSDTDDLDEGSVNLYFTDQRARDAVAGDISSAINALDTDDIPEGSSNLYFTNARAQSAVAADIENAVAAGDITATPEYLAVSFNDVAKQIAATVTSDAGIVTAYSFDSTEYRSAEFLVKVASGTHTEVSKVIVTLDSSDNVAITEYAIVGTNGSLSGISADVSSGDVRLLVNLVNNSSSVMVAGTLLV